MLNGASWPMYVKYVLGGGAVTVVKKKSFSERGLHRYKDRTSQPQERVV